jgi:hypothetical protein
MSVTFLPKIPPFSFTCSMASSTAFLSSLPRAENLPVSDAMRPTRIVSVPALPLALGAPLASGLEVFEQATVTTAKTAPMTNERRLSMWSSLGCGGVGGGEGGEIL